MKKNAPAQVQDGFDLLEYPCQYTFKAMCANQEASIASIKALFTESRPGVHGDSDDGSDPVQFELSPSGKGNYVSVSATMTLSGREQLEAIYSALHANEHVLVAL